MKLAQTDLDDKPDHVETDIVGATGGGVQKYFDTTDSTAFYFIGAIIFYKLFLK